MHVRNFVIIAHIDHGKSTLADRFLELTGTVEKRKMREQYLDMHPLEREKGITIKMAPVRMIYEVPSRRPELLNTFKIPHTKSQNARLEFRNSDLGFTDSKFILNLIDTPGHVDFSYEVSRALAAVEGAILLVDATQGIQAQTVANLDLARKEHLSIVPVVNKVDLASAMTEETAAEVSSLLSVPAESVFRISAKDGTGAVELLEAVIRRTPPPGGSGAAVLRALIFDSSYDPYLGVIAYVRIFDGSVKKGEALSFLMTGASGEAIEVGIFSPEREATRELTAGEIGYIATGVKEPALIRVGDTVTTLHRRPNEALKVEPLPGYREPAPVVFSSVYPENQDDYETLRDALAKLKLNDASVSYEPETSDVLGRGFRAGFLGMLHMEIVSERLRREYGLSLVFSRPTVAFRVLRRGRARHDVIYSAMHMPDSHEIEAIEEPWIRGDIITPPSYLGALTTLVHDHEGAIVETASISGGRLRVSFEAPLREVIVDFYDAMKSVSRGFASTAYELIGYRASRLARLDILVAGERKGVLSEVLPREKIERLARARVGVLKEVLPKALFPIALQAAVDGRVIARETIPALRKDVTGYLYGGDRTRKMKLWKKQKKGKAKLRDRGSVAIAPETFLQILKRRT